MRDFFKYRFKVFKQDKIVSRSALLSIFQLFWHTWQFIDSNFYWESLIRVILYALLPAVAFLSGRDGIIYLFLAFGYITTLTIKFNNYTPFVIITLFCMIKSRHGKDWKQDIGLYAPTLSIYVFLVLIVCQLHDKTISHLVIHLHNCLWLFFITFFFVKCHRPVQHLCLDSTTKRILHDLYIGKMQKEIDYVSKNTIKAKLDSAIIANNLLSREHLITKYALEFEDL